MKTKLFLTALLSFIFCLLSSQVPQGFNYQAIARLTTGDPIINTTLPVRITIQADSLGSTIIWQELHSSVTTNGFGLMTLVLGKGARQAVSAVAVFSAIDWKVSPKFIKTEINYSGWKTMGVTRLWSVPYAKVAENLAGTVNKLAVAGTTTVNDEALFEVKNRNGQTVFAVYNEGVRAYVSDGVKGVKGGFAVGGFGTDKAKSQRYLYVASDSIRMYIDNTAGKKSKGGFAVGGFDQTKGTTDYLNVATDNTGVINPAQNRVLWYPTLDKNAFLAGRVLIQHPDSIGVNSVTTGYESRAKGNYSQAFGYKAIARGDYSTSIGKNSFAGRNNSFAFGNDAQAKGIDSYALGTGAIATGISSFALGSSRFNDTTKVTDHTAATADYAFALGFGSAASAAGAFAMGVLDSASGLGSLSMGYFNRSRGWFSTTFGAGNIVESAGWQGLATGIWTKAGSWAASAFGDRTYAKGHTSFATGFLTVASGHLSATFGDQTVAPNYGSFAIGKYNSYSGTSESNNLTDPIFMIGIGTSLSDRRNALTVYKSGNMDLAGTLNKTLVYPEAVEINYGNTGNRYSYIDFHSDDTYTDFGFRILRNTGLNGSTDIVHRGTGYLNIIAQENASIEFATANTQRMVVRYNGNVGIGVAYPNEKLEVAGILNLNDGISSGIALRVYGREALWYDYTTSAFSWGYGAAYNVFAGHLSVGTIGTYSTYGLYVNGSVYASGGWAGSDARWKKDLEPLHNTLANAVKLQGFRYNWRTDEFPDKNFDKERQIGLIAQEVEKIYPELVKTDDKGYKSVSYEKLTVILLESIKEQQKQLDEQNKKIAELEKLIKKGYRVMNSGL